MAVILTQKTTMSINNSVGAPITIGGITAIAGMDGKATEINVTTLASTAMEFRQGLQDFGNLTLDLIWDKANAGQTEMESAKSLQAERTFIITLPTGSLHIGTFEGFVVSLSFDAGADGVVKGKATIRITGSVVWS